MIRPETADDHGAVARVVRAAFQDPERPDHEPVEVGLTAGLLGCEEYLPGLSLVATEAGEIIGFAITTRGWVGTRPALGLGPIAVVPSQQGTGVGIALMRATIAEADRLGEPVIVLLGHTDYYPRFGFRRAAELGIEPPDDAWDDHFQALPLSAWTPDLTGPFRYAAPFGDL